MFSLQANSTEIKSRDLTNPQILLKLMQELRESVYQQGEEIFSQWEPLIKRRSFLKSAQNLAYYLALRSHDLRPLQAALIPWGLSSLGRIEARVLPNLDAAIATLSAICRVELNSLPPHPSMEVFLEGSRLLRHHTEDVLDKSWTQRWVRIMGTLPTVAASSYEYVKDLLQRGTNCVRINCAHDTPELWEAMIHNVHRAEGETGQPCKIMMDLAGPKPRIGHTINPDTINPHESNRLFPGDYLLLRRDLPIAEDPNNPSFPNNNFPNNNFSTTKYMQATCTIPEVIDSLNVGAQVWIDDGHIGAYVESLTDEGVLLKITHARHKGNKLLPDKGINFPDTLLKLCPLTEKDKQDLDFIVSHADIIGYSFVQEVADIELLHQELQNRQCKTSNPLAIVAKIETPQAIRNLPELIVHAAGKHPFGVMIARGDLAVEIGYQRLAEIQEQILWLCEAAHIPVIWATQVLEKLVKTGIPSRAEMTDAAMSERAECVMLNKGRYQAQAVTILDDILRRMQEHQSKKTPQLRALNSWNCYYRS